jgi:hypothetical protein
MAVLAIRSLQKLYAGNINDSFHQSDGLVNLFKLDPDSLSAEYVMSGRFEN